MDVLESCAVALVLLFGLVGVLLPGVPGLLLCWAAVLWWSLTVRTAAGWGLLIGSTAVVLIVALLRAVMPSERGRTRTRDPRVPWGLLGATGAGGLVGFLVLPAVGGLPGCYAGLYGVEYARSHSHLRARTAARRAMHAIGAATLFAYQAAMLLTVGWFVTALAV